MNIYLLSNNVKMTKAWELFFRETENVNIVCDDFAHFMENNSVDCVVSPANSFGLMDGGYDGAITAWFGNKLQKDVQRYILEKFYGEQPVGSSFIIDTPHENVRLIHTPTMRIPEKIPDESVIYHCMRSCLITALQNHVENILIPAFGAATGRVDFQNVAGMMWLAHRQIYDVNKEISWKYALKTHFRELN